MSEPEIRKAYKVHGRVQGVGFRWWAQRLARSLGLHGSVRNCYDGTVEIIIAGPSEAVEKMCAQLSEGPPAGHVSRLEEIPSPKNIPSDFQIAF